MNQQVYEIGGRKFHAMLVTTVEHDFWLMKHIHEAGLDDVRIANDEKPDAFAVRLLHEVVFSGKAFNLLGGTLIPSNMRDEDWTPQVGEQTAEFFRTLTTADDKQRIQSAVVQLLISFFIQGLSYSNPSRTSLSGAEMAAAQPAQS